MLLKGKIALVTSASRGIGLACSKKLAEAGAKVYLAVRRLDAGLDIVRDIAQNGGSADVVYFDATKEETYSSMIDEVMSKEGKIDVLVNNFGTTDVNKDFDLLSGDTETFFHIINSNLKSVYLPSKSYISYMKNRGGGNIVNISSVSGLFPDMSRLAYGVSKTAINFLTKNIAVQYARFNIRCNAVLPGFVATEASMKNMSMEFLNEFLKNVPLNRPADALDIANAVLFFASDLSSYITGETMPVAGGFGIPSPMYSRYSSMGKRG